MGVYGAYRNINEKTITPSMQVAIIDKNTITLPTKRSDGSDLQNGDWVSVKTGAEVPFTIKDSRGNTFTIEKSTDQLSYNTQDGNWYLNQTKDTDTNAVVTYNSTSESLSETATNQYTINIENKNRLQQVIESAVFEYGTNTIKLQLKKYNLASSTEERYLLDAELELDDVVEEKDIPVLSSAVYKELLDVDKCQFIYDNHNIKLVLVNKKGETLLNKLLALDIKATQASTNAIESNAVYEELINTDKVVFETKKDLENDYLKFYVVNNRGDVLIDKVILIDTTPKLASHNLITSGAVYGERLNPAECLLEQIDNKLHLRLVNLNGNVVCDKYIDIADIASEGNTKLITSNGVYRELFNNDSSVFKYDNTSEVKDTIELQLVNNDNQQKVNKTIDFEDKLVFVNKEQTLYKKTLDFDVENTTKNIAKNIPLSALAPLKSADVNKVLQVADKTYQITPQFLNIFRFVDELPTTPDEKLLYILNDDNKNVVYYYNTKTSAFEKISNGGGIKVVDDLPTEEIEQDTIYAVFDSDSYITLNNYNSKLESWNVIYTDKYGQIAYEKNVLTLENKTINANKNTLGVLVEVDALPTITDETNLDIFYYLKTTEQIYTCKTGEWQLLGEKAIEHVQELPTKSISTEHFYHLAQDLILLGRYGVKAGKEEVCIASAKGLTIDDVLHSWVEINDSWSSYYGDFLEDNDDGEIYRYLSSKSVYSITYQTNLLDSDGIYYYYNSTWYKIFAPDTEYGEVVYTKKTQTLTKKTIDCVYNTINNLPLTSIEEQTENDIDKICQVGDDKKIKLSYLDVIKAVTELPTSKKNEDIFYVFEKKLYYWSEDNSKYQLVCEKVDAVNQVKEMPAEPDKGCVYVVSDDDNNYVVKIYTNESKEWVDIYDSKLEIVYTEKKQTLKNKTIDANENTLKLVKEVTTLPDAGIADGCIYKLANQYYLSTGKIWFEINGTILNVDALPSSNIQYSIYNVTSNYTDLKRYSIKSSVSDIVKIENNKLFVNNVETSWSSVNNNFSYYTENYFDEDDEGLIYRYKNSDLSYVVEYNVKLVEAGLYYYDKTTKEFKTIGGGGAEVKVDDKTIKQATDSTISVNIDKDTITYDEKNQYVRGVKVTVSDTEPTDAREGDIYCDTTQTTSSVYPPIGEIRLNKTEHDYSQEYPGTTWEQIAGGQSIRLLNSGETGGTTLQGALPTLPAITGGAHTHSGSSDSQGNHSHTFTTYCTGHVANRANGSAWTCQQGSATWNTSTTGAHSHNITIGSATPSLSYASDAIYGATTDLVLPTGYGMFAYIRTA